MLPALPGNTAAAASPVCGPRVSWDPAINGTCHEDVCGPPVQETGEDACTSPDPVQPDGEDAPQCVVAAPARRRARKRHFVAMEQQRGPNKMDWPPCASDETAPSVVPSNGHRTGKVRLHPALRSGWTQQTWACAATDLRRLAN